jgi:hypothetical protein
MGIQVRRAAPEDLSWVLSQLKDFSKFYGTKLQLFGDEEYSRNFLLGLIQEHPSFVAVKEQKDENGEAWTTNMCGFIAGIVSPHMYNPKINLLTEAFWWVPEEYRGSRAGALLLEAFISWGKENVDWITFTLEHKSPVSDRCLTKRGFQLQEKNYLLEVQH